MRYQSFSCKLAAVFPPPIVASASFAAVHPLGPNASPPPPPKARSDASTAHRRHTRRFPIRQPLQIHSRPTDDDGSISSSVYIIQRAHAIVVIPTRMLTRLKLVRVVLGRVPRGLQEVMRDAASFIHRHLPRPDVQPVVHLHGIARDDLVRRGRVQRRRAHRRGALSDRRRAREHEHFIDDDDDDEDDEARAPESRRCDGDDIFVVVARNATRASVFVVVDDVVVLSANIMSGDASESDDDSASRSMPPSSSDDDDDADDDATDVVTVCYPGRLTTSAESSAFADARGVHKIGGAPVPADDAREREGTTRTMRSMR